MTKKKRERNPKNIISITRVKREKDIIIVVMMIVKMRKDPQSIVAIIVAAIVIVKRAIEKITVAIVAAADVAMMKKIPINQDLLAITVTVKDTMMIVEEEMTVANNVIIENLVEMIIEIKKVHQVGVIMKEIAEILWLEVDLPLPNERDHSLLTVNE
jgi:hypothetical protein